MITEEHFDALRELRQSVREMTVACVNVLGPAALIHEAFDRGAQTVLTRDERDLLGKLRRVK